MSDVSPGKPAARPVTVLLIDDQPIVAESVRRMLADQPDVRFHYCQDPGKAIETANNVQPTVILQDLVMPEIDGMMLVKFFRANKATRDVPMIVLSSKEEAATKAQAFALGANDYLVKLPDKLEVVARLRYHSRGYVAQLERNEAYEKLAESERHLAQEVATAAKYVKSLLPEKMDGKVKTDWTFVPSTQLGGDMFGYHWLDRDHLALYLLDVSGHGVGSSLLAVSAANVLSARSLADTDFRDPAQVLCKLNDVFPMEKQDNKYFTMFYAVFRKKDRTFAYCNAGHPDALLFTGADAATATLHKLASSGPVVGMLPSEVLTYATERITLGPHARLLVYSDGVFEISQRDGSMWSMPQFIAHVASLAPTHETLIGPVVAKATELRGDATTFEDDFSVVEARF